MRHVTSKRPAKTGETIQDIWKKISGDTAHLQHSNLLDLTTIVAEKVAPGEDGFEFTIMSEDGTYTFKCIITLCEDDGLELILTSYLQDVPDEGEAALYADAFIAFFASL